MHPLGPNDYNNYLVGFFFTKEMLCKSDVFGKALSLRNEKCGKNSPGNNLRLTMSSDQMFNERILITCFKGLCLSV